MTVVRSKLRVVCPAEQQEDGVLAVLLGRVPDRLVESAPSKTRSPATY